MPSYVGEYTNFMSREDDIRALYACGWSQQDIADKYGINQSSVSRALKSKVYTMGPHDIDAMSDKVKATL